MKLTASHHSVHYIKTHLVYNSERARLIKRQVVGNTPFDFDFPELVYVYQQCDKLLDELNEFFGGKLGNG